MSEEKQQLPMQVRMATDADVSYLMKSWLESYKRESRFASRMASDVFFPHHRRLVTDIICRANTVMACDAEDTSHLIGFACGERVDDILLMHFIYVKFGFRQFGVAKKLMEAFEFKKDEPVITSHWTYTLDLIAPRYRVVYNPYLLFTHPKEFRHVAKAAVG